MKLIGVIPGEAIQTGLYPDLEQKLAPVFVDGQNVVFLNRSIQPAAGQYLLTSTQSGRPVRGMCAVELANVAHLFYGTSAKLFDFTVSGGSAEVGSGYTGLSSGNTTSMWSIERWDDWVFATNGKDAPQVYKGVSFAAQSGLGSEFSTAKIVKRLDEFLLYFNLDIGDNVIAFSDRKNPEQFVPATSNAAGTRVVKGLNSGITAAIVANRQIFFTSRDELRELNFVGSPNYFGENPRLKGIGAYGPNALCTAIGYLWGFGPDGVWRSDANGYEYIDFGAVHNDIFHESDYGVLNQNEAYKSVVWHDVHDKQIVVWFPSVGNVENSRGVSFHYASSPPCWTRRSDGRTCALGAGVFPYPLMADAGGNVYVQSSVDTPVNTQDGVLPLSDAGSGTLGYGRGGYGNFGYGGHQDFTS